MLGSVQSTECTLNGVSKNDGIGVEINESISTTTSISVAFIVKITDRLTKSTRIEAVYNNFTAMSDKTRSLAADNTVLSIDSETTN